MNVVARRCRRHPGAARLNELTGYIPVKSRQPSRMP
jgi:hypothetical protein